MDLVRFKAIRLELAQPGRRQTMTVPRKILDPKTSSLCLIRSRVVRSFDRHSSSPERGNDGSIETWLSCRA